MVEDASPAAPGTPEGPPSGPGRTRSERPPRAPGAYLRLPVWQRFVLASVIAVALLVAMVIYVDRNNTDSNPSLNEASEVQANREAEVLVEQDQAPHTVQLTAHVAPAIALERTIHARLAAQIAAGAIDGPLKPARCRPTGPPSGGRHPLSCTVVAGEVTYPFLAVADLPAHSLTYCKRDPPPAPSDNVPVSARCR